MADLDRDTRVVRTGPGTYQATISPDWKIWGPNGGYLSALLLRAVGEETSRERPISYACQYLQVAEFGDATIEVERVKDGSAVSAYRVRLLQDDRRPILAQVWTGDASDGPDHQLLEPPEHFVQLAEAGGRPPVGPMPFWENLEIRGVKHDGGHYSHWYRFELGAGLDDAYLDAARSVVLIDSMHWPARYFMEEEPPLYVGPSLDLYVQFHRSGLGSQWLFSDAVSVCAEHGAAGGKATVWDEDGELIASGGGQSIMRPVEEPY